MTYIAKWFSPIEWSEFEPVAPPVHERRRRGCGGFAPIAPETILRAQELENTGLGRNEVCRRLNVSRAALWRWLGPRKKKT